MRNPLAFVFLKLFHFTLSFEDFFFFRSFFTRSRILDWQFWSFIILLMSSYCLLSFTVFDEKLAVFLFLYVECFFSHCFEDTSFYLGFSSLMIKRPDLVLFIFILLLGFLRFLDL